MSSRFLLLYLLSILLPQGMATADVPADPKPWEAGPTVPIFPDPAPDREVEQGVKYFLVTVTGNGPGLPMRLLVYLPEGQYAAKSLPCVFIAPAGALMWGIQFSDVDTPEQLPYARAGFAVVVYDIAGSLSLQAQQHQSEANLLPCIKEYVHSDGGLVNGEMAIDYVLAKIPQVNPDQLYSSGHSSAGTQAMNLSRDDPRIKACCAYAPMLDLATDWMKTRPSEKIFPGFKAFEERKTPLLHAADYNKPLFLFHADDDPVVTQEEILKFVGLMTSAHKPLTFSQAAEGGHYQPMINTGLQEGIKFLISLGAKPIPAKVGGD